MVSLNQWFAQVWFDRYQKRRRARLRRKSHLARLEQVERREAPGGLVHVWMDDVLAATGLANEHAGTSSTLVSPGEQQEATAKPRRVTLGTNDSSVASWQRTANDEALNASDHGSSSHLPRVTNRLSRPQLTESEILGGLWDDDSLGGTFSTGNDLRLNQQFHGNTGGGSNAFGGIFGPSGPIDAPWDRGGTVAGITSAGSGTRSDLPIGLNQNTGDTTPNSSNAPPTETNDSGALNSEATEPLNFEASATAISAEQWIVHGTLPESVAAETRLEIYRSTSGQIDQNSTLVGSANTSTGTAGTDFRALVNVDLNSNEQLLIRLPHFANALGTVHPADDLQDDSDSDGIPGVVEDFAPNSGDGNNDGVLDRDQANVASFFSGTKGSVVTIQSNAGTLRDVVATQSAERPADRVSLPYGVFDFAVDDVEMGGVTVVEVTLPEDARPSSYYKTDPATGQWERFGFDGTTGAIIQDNKVFLFLQDGGRGDADGIANGVIVDPGGPGVDDGVLDLPGLVDSGLTGWTIAESGGDQSPGTVHEVDGDIVLTEGDSFQVTLQQEVTIPENPAVLTFDFLVTFDNADDDFINDAFEVALVDQHGVPVVPIFQGNRDAFFNWTEGESAATGSTTTFVGQTVELDIAKLPAGRTYDVVFRLVNNDDDTTTTVTLLGAASPVVANADSFSVAEDSSANLLDVLANDEGEGLAISEVSQGSAGGSISIVNDQLEYTPAANFFGTEVFTYGIIDDNDTVDTGDIVITVTEVNDPPTAVNDAFTIDEDQQRIFTVAEVTANDSVGPANENTQTLSITGVGKASHGTVVLNGDGTITYTPDEDYHGSDSFTYTVTDDGTTDGAADPLSDTASINLTITPINDPPVAVEDNYGTTADETLVVATVEGILSNDSDPESQSLTAELVQTTADGVLTLSSNGSFTYVPDSGFTGVDTFTYKAKDASGDYSAVTEVQIQVGPGTFVVPGDPDTLYVFEVAIEAVNLEASYRNELGLYIVNNAQGEVGGLLPDESNGYANAALTDATRQVVFARPQDNDDLIGQVYQVIVPGGSQIAFYLAQNTTTQSIISTNPSNSTSGPHAFFSFKEANPDQDDQNTSVEFEHFRLSTLSNGTLLYEVEDLDGGGDRDYNDLAFTVAATPIEIEGSIKFLVADSKADRAFLYTDDGTWVGQPQLDNGNSDARGITSSTSGDYRWTVDAGGDVFVYDEEGNTLGQWTINGTVDPEGIATDGTNLWIVDANSEEVLYFAGAAAIGTSTELLTGTHSPTSSFSLDSANSAPKGITTDGTTLWVVDEGADKVFVYAVSNGALQGSWNLDGANENAGGITTGASSSSTSLWVVDYEDGRVYHYANSTSAVSGSLNAADTFDLGVGNFDAQGIADPITDVGETIYSAHTVSLKSGVETKLDGLIGDGSYGVNDVDMYEITLSAGQTLNADIDSWRLDDGTSSSYGGNSHLRLFDSYGGEVADAFYHGGTDPDSGYGGDPVLEYTSSYGGMYYLGVSADGNQHYDPTSEGYGGYGGTFDYQLQLNVDDDYGGGPEIEVFDDSYGGSLILDSSGSYNFGTTPLSTDLTQTFLVTNDGDSILTLGTINVTSNFSVASSFGSTSLAPSQSTTFTIRFEADYGGFSSGQVSFSTNDTDENPFNFQVSGTVDDYGGYGGAEISVFDDDEDYGGNSILDNTGEFDFGQTGLNNPLAHTFHVTNDGDATLNLGSISVPSGFSITSGFGSSSLSPSQSTTFTVQFDAASGGLHSGQINFSTNDSDENPFNFEISGSVATGEIVVLGDVSGSYELEDGISTIDFGSVPSDSHSRRTFYIRNQGDTDLTVSSLTLPTGYSVVGATAPYVIAPDSQHAVTLELSGPGTGLHAGALIIHNSDTDEASYSISLAGILEPPSLDAVNDTIGGIIPGSNVTLDVLDNDLHSGATIMSVTAVNGEAVTVAADGKSLEFVAPADFEGATFLYTISDGITSDTATVTLQANLDPTAEADEVHGIEAGFEVYLYVLDNDFDADGDAISISSVGSPGQGTIENHGSYLIYQAAAGFTGDSFQYTITDAAGNTATSTVTLHTPAASQPSLEVDWNRLADVTPSMNVNYRRTSFYERTDTLYAGLDLENVGTYSVRGPVLLGVKNLDNPLVAVQGHDGVSPTGIPYYNITDLVVSDSDVLFEPRELAEGIELQFYNPTGTQFRYELVVLAFLNEAPEFQTVPTTEVVGGTTYQYHADATDPDNDAVTYSLFSGPPEMTVYPSSGVVHWDTTGADLGTYPVILRATDPYGAYTDQQFILNVVQTGNRPPRFTSFPETDAYVNTPYEYQLTAFDADNDVLEYSLEDGPDGLTMTDSARGLLRWTPTAEQVDDTHFVLVKVTDNQGGEAYQEFEIYVNPEQGNTPPVIVSEPATQLVLPEIAAGMSVGDVTPVTIDIALENGETFTQTVTLELDDEGILGADIVFVVDESGSMLGDHQWLQDMVVNLESYLVAQGITNNRYSLVGFGQASGTYSQSGEYRLHISPEQLPTLGDVGDTLSTAGSITVSEGRGERVAGNIGDGAEGNLDVDMFEVQLDQGDELLVDLDALILDDGTALSSFDGKILLYDASGNQVAASSGYGGAEDLLRYTVNSTGTYYVGVSGQANTSYDPTVAGSGVASSTGDYELSISVHADPVNDVGDTILQSSYLTLPAQKGIVAHHTQGNGQHDNNDVDMYGFDLTEGERVVIDVDSMDDTDGYGGGVDTQLRVFDSAGNILAGNTRVISSARDPQIVFVAPATGTYYVGVSHNLNGTYDPHVANSGPEEPYLGHVFSTNSGNGWGDATEISELTTELLIDGSEEDGYSGIEAALEYLDFRPGASSHVILITDEPRAVPSGVTATFNSVLNNLDQAGTTLHSIVSAEYADASSVVALGGSSDGTAYLEAPEGNYTTSTGFQVTMAASTTEADYINLAFQNDGTVWSLDELRDGGDTAESFTNAFIDVMTTTVLEDLTIDLLATDAGVSVVNLTGTQSASGTTLLSFDVLITGDGNAHAFDLQFVRATDASQVVASIPVTITTGYRYDVDAVDADEDELTYSLIGETHGAQIDPVTGLLRWQPTAPGSYEFTTRVADGRGGQDLQTWTVEVLSPSAVNADPIFDAVSAKLWEAERDYTLDVVANDADGDTVLYRLIDDITGGNPVPSGMTIDQLTGRIQWSPTADQTGVYDIRVQAIDGRGGVGILDLEIEVELAAGYANERPEITSTPVRAAIENETYRYDVTAIDMDNDTLTFELPHAPDGMAIDPATGRIAWVPSSHQVGTRTVYVRVQDGQGGIDLQTFDVTVASFNDAPEFVSVPPSGAAIGEAFEYQAEAIDPNGDVVTYSLDPESVAAGMAIGITSGLLVWNNPTGGTHRVQITASDGRGKAAIQEFVLAVNDNAPPTITSIPTGPAFVGIPYVYDITYEDPNDADIVTLSLDQASLDRGMTLVGDQLQWTPNSLGEVAVAITATDTDGAYYTQTFTLPVVAQTVESQPPEFTSIPSGPALVGQEWTYELTAVDPDGDSFNFSLEDNPSGMSLSGTTLSWTPMAATAGATVVVKVTDSHQAYSTQSFQLPAIDPPLSNDAPEITSVPTGPAVVGELYAYQVHAHDPNGDPLTYSVDATSEGNGVTIDSQTGRLTWTPASAGDYPITVSVSDGTDTATQMFTLPVINPLPGNSLPVITSSPVGPAVENEAYQYQVIATDPDDDDLTYSLETYPTGMTIDSETGLLEWPPATAGDYDVKILVDDGAGGVTAQEFTLPVVATPPANDPPVIRSAPLTSIRLGQGYTYQLDAYDPDGDPLTFDLEDAPVGMTVDSSGRISWSAQVLGTYDVEIVVADGQGNYAVQTYAIEVQPDVQSDQAPEITSRPTGPAVKDRPYQYQVQAHDPEGDTLIYSLDAASIARGILIDSGTGLLTWTPDSSETVRIQITVSDGEASVIQSFDLAVVPNAPPVIISNPVRTTDVGSSYTYDIVAADPNAGDEVTVSLLDVGSLPAGLAFIPGSTSGTATISGTPTVPGLYSITVLAVDSAGAVAQQPFQLRVADPNSNTAPTVELALRDSIQAEQLLLHQVQADDIDGDPLTYTLTTFPAGMTIDNRGLIQWTPTAAQINNPATPYQVTVEVFDGEYTDSATHEIHVVNQPNNTDPEITSEPRENALADGVYAYEAAAEDADGDLLRWQLTQYPRGMQVNPNTGRVQWRPERGQVGEHTVTLRVSDLQGGYDEQTFTVTVRGANRPAMIVSDPVFIGKPNELYTYQVLGEDPDGDQVHFTVDSATATLGVTVDYNTGLLEWQNPPEGTHQINVRVADELGLGVQQIYSLTISDTASNHAPEITSTAPAFAEFGTPYEYDPVVEDPDVGDTISYALEVIGTAPVNAPSFSTSTGEFDWSPAASEIDDTFAFRITATDAASAYSRQLFYVTVRDANVAPVINSNPIETVTAGRTYRYDVNASDANGDPLTYELDVASLVRGMEIDRHGRIVWGTDDSDIGTYPVTVTVTDDRGASAPPQTFDLEVVADTIAPNVELLISQPLIRAGRL